MASHRHCNGGDCDKHTQPLGEPQPCVLEIEALCFAVSEHAFDELSPAIVPQNTFATQRLGAGYDQQLTPLDALCPKMQIKSRLACLGWQSCCEARSPLQRLR